MVKRSPRGGRPKQRGPIADRRAWYAVALAMAVPVVTMLTLRFVVARVPDSATSWLRKATAWVAFWAVRAAGVPVTLSQGTDLGLRNHILRIDLACTAFDWFILFGVVVAVVPVTGRKKLIALLIGLPTILVLNILRLVAVALVSEYAPREFAFAHDVVLQTSIAVAVGCMWVVFLWASRDDWKPGWGAN